MIQLSELIGHGSLDLATGMTGGTVTGVAIEGNRVVSLRIGRACIATSSIRGIEWDVVTYDSAHATAGGDPTRVRDPRGTRVLDLHGDVLGTISDLTITATGEIELITLDDGLTLPGSALRVVGSYAAIVAAAA